MRFIVIFFLVLLAAGCRRSDELSSSILPRAALEALQNGTDFELLSLEPYALPKNAHENFHEWKILGRTRITDQAARERLVKALVDGVNNSDGSVASGFNPRHGIRVNWNGESHDFLICFECLRIKWHRGAENPELISVSATPKATFDAALQDAGVPLAPKERPEGSAADSEEGALQVRQG